MKSNYKLKSKSGIYQIKNKINGKVYIGRTKCFYRRCLQYRAAFKHKDITRINQHLMNAFNKYGIENFVFEPLEFCHPEIIEQKELYWMKLLNSTDRNKGYNLRLDSDGHMITHPETSLKISNRLSKEWANGTRKDHSSKLKAAWSNRDRKAQSQLMSKTLTKYRYIVFDGSTPPVLLNYRQLKSSGLASVFSKFARHKTNQTLFKGYNIKRVNYED